MEEKIKDIPVFIINGFLDAGKTQFIKFTMQQEYFQTDGNTLLLLCEQGEEQYERKLLKDTHTILHTIEEEEDFTIDLMNMLTKQYNPERILIEWNGFWKQDSLKVPKTWFMNQTITILDTITLDSYLRNMKAIMGPMLQKSELVICNRADNIPMEKMGNYYLQIRAMASEAEIIFEGEEGEIRGDFSIELPYDLEQDKLVIENRDFGIFYIDSMERTEKYAGKEVEYIGQILKPKGLPPKHFVVGRMVMTCCEADMRFLGFICRYSGIDAFQNKDWVKIRGILKNELMEAYGGNGAVIEGKEMLHTKEVKEIVGF